MKYILLLTSLIALLFVEFSIYYAAFKYLQSAYPDSDLLIILSMLVLWILAKATIRAIDRSLSVKQ